MAKWDDSYDPHENRTQTKEHGLTHIEGVIHVVKGSMATGLLALPEGFKLAGTINGIVSFTIFSFFGTYCFHLLLYSQYLLCKIKKVGLLTYAQSMEAAFEVGPDCLKKMAPCAVPFMDFIYLVYQTGVLCVYVIFMAANLKLVCDQHFSDQHLYIYMLYTFVPVVLLCLVPDIKWFTPFSLFGNIVSFITIGVIFYYVTKDLPDFNSLPYLGDYRNFPVFFGTSIFALLSVPSVLLVENAMKDPAYFISPFGALNTGFATVAILYIVVGVMGYWKYGDEIKSSITLNFPESEILSQVIKVMYVIAIWLTYAFKSFVQRDVMWYGYIKPHLKEDSGAFKKWSIDCFLRFLIVLSTYLLSVCIPYLGIVISLSGGLFLSLMGIVFPAFMETCALWPDDLGKHKWRLWKNLLICALGLFGMVSNVYSSVRDIIKAMRSEEVKDTSLFL